MPIFYNVRKKVCSFAQGRKERYFLIAKSWDRVSYEDLIEQMVRHTSLTREEAKTALAYLQESIIQLLKLGCTIDLGYLGHLMVTIQSEGSDTPEEATVDKIRNKRICFVPAKKLREAVRRLPVEHFPDKGETVRGSGYSRAMKKAQEETERRLLSETVRNCLAEGLPVGAIARITGLPEVDVREMVQSSSSSM